LDVPGNLRNVKDFIERCTMAVLVALTTLVLVFGTVYLGLAAVAIARSREGMASAIFQDLVDLAAAMATPDGDLERQSTQRVLMQAGYSPERSARFFGMRALGALLLPPLLLIVANPPYWSLVFVVVFTGFVVGYMMPWYILVWLQRRRQAEIRSALPTSLDLLITCLDAGLAIEGALTRVARELRSSSPAFCEELDRLLVDVRGGVPRQEAFRQLPVRSGVEELGILGDALGRATRGGQGLTTALRELAQELRTLQVLGAESSAAAAGPLMTVAMIVFILPLFFVVIVAPSVVQVVDTMVMP
jgi:tight adherence protein C